MALPAWRRPGAGGLRLIPGIPRAPERARVVGEPREGARSRVCAPLSVPRLRPQRPRPGPAGPWRASGECPGRVTLGDRERTRTEGGCSCSRDGPAPADPGPGREHRPRSKASAGSRPRSFWAARGLRAAGPGPFGTSPCSLLKRGLCDLPTLCEASPESSGLCLFLGSVLLCSRVLNSSHGDIEVFRRG